MLELAQIISAMFLFKCFLIGSSFNFYLYFKYGKRYTDWYFNTNRTTFPIANEDTK